jgi:phage terminase large subunit
MQRSIDIAIDIPDILLPFIESTDRFNVLYGGRGGAKSWTVAQILLIRASEKKLLILCTREVQNTIRDSVHKLLADTIDRLGLTPYYWIGKDTIIGKNGSKFIFRGLRHNISEIKSTEGVDICWTEEAQNVSRDSWDVLIPTIRKENSQFFICFNPDDPEAPVYQDFVINGMHGSRVVKINWDQNAMFPDVLKKQLEWDKKYNYEKYLHVWEGNVKSISDSCIFKGKFTIQDFEPPVDKEGNPIQLHYYYGADWGFSEDPTCLVRSYEYDECLWIDYEAYGVGVELDEIEQLFDSIPGSRDNQIIGDNQRPDTISYLRRKGFAIKSSRKGRNSIKDGIEHLKNYKKIIIHPRCKNTKYEFENYSYKQNPATGEILPIILDKDNHIIDSLRYSHEDNRKGIAKLQKKNIKNKSVIGW